MSVPKIFPNLVGATVRITEMETFDSQLTPIGSTDYPAIVVTFYSYDSPPRVFSLPLLLGSTYVMGFLNLGYLMPLFCAP
eukprot:g17902.t1